MQPPGLRVIAAVSWILPSERRVAWRLEWEGEAAYAWQRLCAEGRPKAWAKARLRIRVLACVIDALVEKGESMKVTGLGNDFRFALRGLVRKPGFTSVAVLTLALGIGATTAVFTLLDGVLLRPLPYPASQELLQLDHIARDGQDELPMSPGLYLLYRDQATSLATIAMWNGTFANLMMSGEPERIEGQVVTPSFFTTLGAEAARGRGFTEEEGRPGAPPVVILSDALWKSRFGSDPSILGQTLDMNGVSREVVGIMPADFGFPDRNARFWVPLAVNETQAPVAGFSAGGIARMAPGQTAESVRAELEGMLARLADLVPGDAGGAEFLKGVGIHTRIAPLKDALVGDLATTLWILFATVGIVLVIACANVANLLLVRAEGRQRELAVRIAMGAGRMQVLGSFLGESLLLATAGGAVGLLVASSAVRLTSALIPTDLPRMAEIGIDGRVLSFTAVIALGCAIFFGFFPLLRYGTSNLAGQLREGGARGATGSGVRNRLRNGLVVSQIALALVLLIGSGLMLRSFMSLRAVDPGFIHDGILTARVIVPNAEAREWEAVDQFWRQLQQRLESAPGVSAVGLVSAVPLGGSGMPYTSIEVEDQPRAANELPVFASRPQSGTGYFEAMGIPVLEGRSFQPGDGGNGFRAVVVSQAFAEKWWPGQSPLGRRLRLGADNEDWYEIVGVVGNVRQQNLEELGRDMVYFPMLLEVGGQVLPARGADIIIRTTGEPTALVSILRSVVRELNPRIPVANPRTMDEVFRGATARTSFTMAMLGSASGIALLLGLVGIYGVISYVVSQRTREIGVRMALGASSATVRGMVVRQGVVLGTVGVSIGLVAAALLSRVMGSLLYGVSAIDPITYVSVAASLVGVAVLASLIPALRAAGVDPSRALRSE